MNKEKNFDIYESLIEIKAERDRLKQEESALMYKQSLLQLACTHDVCIKLWDHQSHKIGYIYYLFCPICGKVQKLLPFTEVEKTTFVNSKIIDLTEFNYNDFESKKSFIDTIQYEIIKNYNYYYNDNSNTEDLSNKLYESIKPKSKIKILDKFKKN